MLEIIRYVTEICCIQTHRGSKISYDGNGWQNVHMSYTYHQYRDIRPGVNAVFVAVFLL